MQRIVNRLAIGILVICNFLYVTESVAQDYDSLEKTIDRILESEFSSRKTNHKAVSNDSTAILKYLSEGSRYGSINSDSSHLYLRKALDMAIQSQSPENISLATEGLGRYYINREMYNEAMMCYLQSLRIEEKRKDEIRIADLNDDLGMVYYYMEVFGKSMDYYQKALAIYQLHNATPGIARTLNHIGSLHNSREYCETRNEEEKLSDFNTAINYYAKSGRLYSLTNDKLGIAKVNQNIASVYNKMKKPEIALVYILKSLAYYRKINDPEGISSTLYTLGKTYYRLKEYGKSIEAYRESEEISLKGNLTGGIQYLYEALAMPYIDTKDYKNAYDCYIKYMTLRDSVYNSGKSKQIFELETKYQSELKQQEILRLKAEKKRRNSLIYLLTALSALLVFSVNYYVRLVKKNKIIAEQDLHLREEKIRELEKERLLLATKSVLEGEEAERTRLAGDLHNGLGGLLSGIKINLSSMKENSVMTHENVSAFNHVISLLDTSISELRRIAHNLMPETLNHYGLKTALEDFCTQVAPAGPPEIRLQFFGDEIRYTRELELNMYRIIQELVNNALKHAGATRINIEVFSEIKRLYARVTDNGKGFEISGEGKEKKGKGIDNIRDRVIALNGIFDIWSRPGEGTEISVEIKIS